jgi:hypothetical protein
MTSNWKLVSKELPEMEDHMGVKESDLVLIIRGTGSPDVAFLSGGKWFSYWSRNGCDPIATPLYWTEINAPKWDNGEYNG